MSRIHPLLLAALAALILAAPVTAQEVSQDDLIAVIKSDAPKAEKAVPCKLLAVYGDAKAVPALAALLPDPELTSWARIALEAIPGAEADAALRDALDTTDGRTKIGVINSIAYRGDAKAVDALVKLLDAEDADIACAAAAGLGKIGGEAAQAAVLAKLDDDRADVRRVAAEACVYLAEKLDAADATAIYEKILAADVPKQRVVEATRGLILVKGQEAGPMIVDLLKSDDKVMFRLGLNMVREAQGEANTTAIVGAMASMPGDRVAHLLAALAGRGDAKALPAVLEAAKSDSADVRNAAVAVLTTLGDVTCIPTLLEIATGSDDATAAAITKSLAAMSGDGVDAAIAEELSDSKGKARVVLIDVVGARRIDAVDELLKAANEKDAAIRVAALAALGETIGADHLDVLIERVVSPPMEGDAAPAAKALRAACVRMPNGDECAARLYDAMRSGASVDAGCAILEVLGAMGNKTALRALHTVGRSSVKEYQDTATRCLGEWMTVEAAPVLLDLAKTAPEETYRIRSMRGYLRLVRQFNMSDEERVEMCRAAMATANRDAEKKLALEVMARYPSVEMLQLAVDAAKQPSLKDDAAKAALAIAQGVGPRKPGVKDLLEQVGFDVMDIEIVKAEYGAEGKWKDVTPIIKKATGGLPLITLSSENYNKAFGGDPAPSVPKQLKIQYRINGKDGEASFGENAEILLPTP